MPDRTAVRAYRDPLVRDLSELIKIPSVNAKAERDAPFGPACAKALEFMLDRGKALGFSVKNVDNYAGHVEYGSDGPLIGVLTHLDVVPAGDGWVHNPFGGELDGGAIYGRGAADNKGPAMASLYVLRAFADQVPSPNARIRLIFGTNEESGMAGVRKYFESEPIPDMGFSPDAGYPLYNREMGIVNVHLAATRTSRRIVTKLTGGEALNMVANEAKAVILPEHAELVSQVVAKLTASGSVEERISVEVGDSGVTVSVKGISAHGGRPANGVSAIAYLVAAIDEISAAIEDQETKADQDSGVETEIRALRRLIGFETRGDSLGIACRDSESGELSVNWGTIEVDGNTIKTGLNLRYPVTANYDSIVSALRWRAGQSGYESRGEHHMEPLFIPEDADLIVKLLRAYEKATGEQSGPLSMSGGTYARTLKNNGVAFGAGFPGDINNVHQPDEHIAIDSLMRHCEISLQALFELANVE